MTGAGELRERIGFFKRVTSDDGYGNTEGAFGGSAEFTVAAKVKPRLGGEDIVGARITGKNFVNITVRYSSQTILIETNWLAKDARTGQEYNIKSIVNPDERKEFLEILAEKGSPS